MGPGRGDLAGGMPGARRRRTARAGSGGTARGVAVGGVERKTMRTFAGFFCDAAGVVTGCAPAGPGEIFGGEQPQDLGPAQLRCGGRGADDRAEKSDAGGAGADRVGRPGRRDRGCRTRAESGADARLVCRLARLRGQLSRGGAARGAADVCGCAASVVARHRRAGAGVVERSRGRRAAVDRLAARREV